MLLPACIQQWVPDNDPAHFIIDAAHLPVDHPKRKRKYLNGDVNTCLIRTVNGLSISITHDTDFPPSLQPHQSGAGHQRTRERLAADGGQP